MFYLGNGGGIIEYGRGGLKQLLLCYRTAGWMQLLKAVPEWLILGAETHE